MFNSHYISFFEGLAKNNTTEWFNENKKTYEKEVKKPFELFVQKLIDEIHSITPGIQIDPKDAIFRINRDIRFSNDKSPYKIEMSAVISKAGKKTNPCPGLYVSIGAEKVVVGSGLKMLEKDQLAEVRYHIANNQDEFDAIINNQDFRTTFGEVQGDIVKRLPEEFKAAAETQPLLYNTTFLAMTELPASEIIKPDFLDLVVNIYKTSLPFARFLSAPIDL
jgi:uncharacterized protein (TIGR02453 family)